MRQRFYSRKVSELTQQIVGDIGTVSPDIKVVTQDIAINDAWDFEDVYCTLFDFAGQYPFDTEHED